MAQLTERRDTLQVQLNNADAPLAEWSETLQLLLQNRMSVESELRAVDSQLHGEQNELKQLESARDALSKSLASSQEQQQQ